MSNIKLLSKINSFKDVQKSLQDIEKYLRNLEKAIQSPAEQEVTDKDGKTGDIKTTKNADGSYTFEIRTEDGWKTPVFKEHPIAFKEKLASYSKKKLAKSISEIQADDETKGTSIAEQTIFDEKNNKFDVSHLTGAQTGGLPKPDFESDWTELDETTDVVGTSSGIVITHNLGSIPKLVQLYCYDGDCGATHYHSVSVGLSENYSHGITYQLTTTSIILHTGNSSWARVGDGATINNINQGYIKALLWK